MGRLLKTLRTTDTQTEWYCPVCGVVVDKENGQILDPPSTGMICSNCERWDCVFAARKKRVPKPDPDPFVHFYLVEDFDGAFDEDADD